MAFLCVFLNTRNPSALRADHGGTFQQPVASDGHGDPYLGHGGLQREAADVVVAGVGGGQGDGLAGVQRPLTAQLQDHAALVVHRHRRRRYGGIHGYHTIIHYI